MAACFTRGERGKRRHCLERTVIVEVEFYGAVTVTLVAFTFTVKPEALVVVKVPLREPKLITWNGSPGFGRKLLIKLTLRVPLSIAVTARSDMWVLKMRRR